MNQVTKPKKKRELTESELRLEPLCDEVNKFHVSDVVPALLNFIGAIILIVQILVHGQSHVDHGLVYCFVKLNALLLFVSVRSMESNCLLILP